MIKQRHIYMFLIINQGGVIISADKRTNPILAFSESGNFDMDLKKMPFGVAQWIDKSASNIKEKRINKVKTS
ncbi:MAG: Spi family protease inhibitor, partial [Prolixibacteraceae bacterium]